MKKTELPFVLSGNTFRYANGATEGASTEGILQYHLYMKLCEISDKLDYVSVNKRPQKPPDLAT